MSTTRLTTQSYPSPPPTRYAHSRPDPTRLASPRPAQSVHEGWPAGSPALSSPALSSCALCSVSTRVLCALPQMVRAIQRQAKHQDRPPIAAARSSDRRLKYTRYLTAPGPPMPECASPPLHTREQSTPRSPQPEVRVCIACAVHARCASPRRFAHLTGHGSYELAFRDPALYSWLLQQECARCTKPLAAWKPLGGYDAAQG